MKLVALYFPESMTLDFEAEGTTAVVWAGRCHEIGIIKPVRASSHVILHIVATCTSMQGHFKSQAMTPVKRPEMRSLTCSSFNKSII